MSQAVSLAVSQAIRIRQEAKLFQRICSAERAHHGSLLLYHECYYVFVYNTLWINCAFTTLPIAVLMRLDSELINYLTAAGLLTIHG